MKFWLIIAAVLGSMIVSGTVAQAAAKPAASSTLIVWNGEAKNVGVGWAVPPGSTIAPQTGVDRFGKTAVLFTSHATGSWCSFGWRWEPWGTNAGVSAAGYKSLTFWVKETGAKKTDLWVWIKSGPVAAKTVDVKTVQPNLQNGQWDQVKIPLASLETGVAGFNPRDTQEIDFNGGTPTGLAIYIDDIGFSK